MSLPQTKSDVEAPVANKKTEVNSLPTTKYAMPPQRTILDSVSPMAWVTSWVILNIVLTILNKAVFQFGNFNFPITLSAVHMLCSWLMAWYVVKYQGWFSSATVDSRGKVMLFLFSSLFGLNIIFGNLALRYVNVSLVQVTRATIPGITMVLSYFMVPNSKISKWVASTMVPICFGMMLTVNGEIEFHYLGFFFTVVGCFFSALKVVLSNRFLVGSYDFNPMDFLYQVSPMALVQLIPLIYFFGEWEKLSLNWQAFCEWKVLTMVIGSGVVAFLLNLTNFYTNAKTSPLTLSVSGNFKQVSTIFISMLVFKNDVATVGKTMGIAITIAGTILYSYFKYHKW